MKLYDARTPNSLRVNLFLVEKNIEPARIPVAVLEGATRTPEFLAKNSLGELPVLELDDGTVLTESVAICRYLEGVHPEPSLFGRDPVEQARIEMWSRRMEQQIFQPIGDFAQHSFPFFADKIEQIPAFAESRLRRFDQNLVWWNDKLSDGRPFVAGERFSNADITAAPAMYLSDLFERPWPEELTHLKRWEAAMRARPSLSRFLSQASESREAMRSAERGAA